MCAKLAVKTPAAHTERTSDTNAMQDEAKRAQKPASEDTVKAEAVSGQGMDESDRIKFLRSRAKKELEAARDDIYNMGFKFEDMARQTEEMEVNRVEDIQRWTVGIGGKVKTMLEDANVIDPRNTNRFPETMSE